MHTANWGGVAQRNLQRARHLGQLVHSIVEHTERLVCQPDGDAPPWPFFLEAVVGWLGWWDPPHFPFFLLLGPTPIQARGVLCGRNATCILHGFCTDYARNLHTYTRILHGFCTDSCGVRTSDVRPCSPRVGAAVLVARSVGLASPRLGRGFRGPRVVLLRWRPGLVALGENRLGVSIFVLYAPAYSGLPWLETARSVGAHARARPSCAAPSWATGRG